MLLDIEHELAERRESRATAAFPGLSHATGTAVRLSEEAANRSRRWPKRRVVQATPAPPPNWRLISAAD
ncbi:hypothetical protein GCM10027288_00500 [Bordetella tumbae]